MENQALIDIVNYAYKNVPMYKELFGENITISSMEEFKKLPFTNKEMYTKYDKKAMSQEHLNYPLTDQLRMRRTSGSSGICLNLGWNHADDTHSLMELWLIRKKYYGITPADKCCYFYTTTYYGNTIIEDDEEVRKSYDNRSLGFNKCGFTKERLVKIYKDMLEFDPKYIITQPSIAILLADYVAEEDVEPLKSLTYVEVSGELLLESDRTKIETVLQCKVGNQYGCNEANSIAMEQGDHRFHINKSNVYVEIVKDGNVVPYGEIGDIYITSLHNHATPFIRYQLGDQGKLIREGDELYIELEKARCTQFILDEFGNKIPAYIFLRPIEHISEQLGNIIKQFQIIQTDINQFSVKFALHPKYIGWKDAIAEMFTEYLKQDTLKNATWKFEACEHLFPEDTTGKLSYFYNEVSGGYK